MLKQFQQALLPPRMIMKVAADNGNGTVAVVSLSGSHGMNAIGSGTVGGHVYVQDGRVLGSAPDLPHGKTEV